MKKSVKVLAILAIMAGILAACNFPLSNQQSDEDTVATSVALTVAAANAQVVLPTATLAQPTNTLPALPKMDVSEDVMEVVNFIDVLWFKKGTNDIECAFEVEKTTSIYSGLLRLKDLICSLSDNEYHVFVLIPDDREKEMLAQLKRPAFADLRDKNVSYILFDDLCCHAESICKLGDDYRILKKICRDLAGAK